MPELDRWVTEHEVESCGFPSKHVYLCPLKDAWSEDLCVIGATLKVDEATYEICRIEEVAVDCGDYLLVYAHYVPQSMDESEWNGLYGDPELADAG